MGLKFLYFDVRGFGEYIRTLLVDNKIDFEDKRITFDEWPALKGSMPMGQMPVLQEGEKKIPQTHAILRHLARTHGLYGDSECEKTFLDVFQEALKDVRMKYIWMILHDYENGKKQFDDETYPGQLEAIEKLFTTHANGEKYVLGDKVSYVDYILFEELELALANSPKRLDPVPHLKAFHERFSKRPNLQDYLAKRRDSKPQFHGNGRI